MKLVYHSARLLVLLGTFILLLGGCGPGEEPVPTISVAETDTISPLPTATAVALASPTAEETATPATAEVAPTPQAGLGIVHGTLQVEGQPAAGQTLYLVPLIATGDSMSVAGLDTNTDPRTETDAAGNFLFVGIAPGEYALAIISPIGPVVIRGTDDDEITADVRADEVTQLGIIDIPPFS